MQKPRGRPPLEPKEKEGKLTPAEISRRQRERMRAAGKGPATYWIDTVLADEVKKEARRRGFSTAADFVELLLARELGFTVKLQKPGASDIPENK